MFTTPHFHVEDKDTGKHLAITKDREFAYRTAKDNAGKKR